MQLIAYFLLSIEKQRIIRNICFNGIFQYADIFAIAGIILFLIFNQKRKNIKNIIIFFLFSLIVILTNYINNVKPTVEFHFEIRRDVVLLL